MEKYSNKKFSYSEAKMAQIALKVLHGQAEVKSFDQGFGSSVDSTGSLQKLTAIPQGDTDSTRQGDQLEVFKISLQCAFAGADATNVLRYIIFRWEQDDSSAGPSTVGDLLQTSSVFSPYNRDNLRAKKFIILYDKLFKTSLNGVNIDTAKKDLKVNFKIRFQAGATSGTSNVYAMYLSDSGTVTHPTFNVVVRTWYHDV